MDFQGRPPLPVVVVGSISMESQDDIRDALDSDTLGVTTLPSLRTVTVTFLPDAN